MQIESPFFCLFASLLIGLLLFEGLIITMYTGCYSRSNCQEQTNIMSYDCRRRQLQWQKKKQFAHRFDLHYTARTVLGLHCAGASGASAGRGQPLTQFEVSASMGLFVLRGLLVVGLMLMMMVDDVVAVEMLLDSEFSAHSCTAVQTHTHTHTYTQTRRLIFPLSQSLSLFSSAVFARRLIDAQLTAHLPSSSSSSITMANNVCLSFFASLFVSLLMPNKLPRGFAY